MYSFHPVPQAQAYPSGIRELGWDARMALPSHMMHNSRAAFAASPFPSHGGGLPYSQVVGSSPRC